jgi:hypothetical protein
MTDVSGVTHVMIYFTCVAHIFDMSHWSSTGDLLVTIFNKVQWGGGRDKSKNHLNAAGDSFAVRQKATRTK